ncbi:hypothetical protein [Clostridium sp. AWRP]|uniref:hypothetical protein n=1 Tax=Clostridium sp. AWRP TaxID=2212991 RepID=UPI001586CEF2|nr:hypothetical protein [Clostridium sp. AWRP]
MENRTKNKNLHEELQDKIQKIEQSLIRGKEITIMVTPKGLKIKEAAIKIIK